MRYRGQGHEITVSLPAKPYQQTDGQAFKQLFEAAYTALFGRIIPGLEIEALTWTLSLATAQGLPGKAEAPPARDPAAAIGNRRLFDAVQGEYADAAVYARTDLLPGASMAGPAVIVEDETSTLVPASFNARINGLGQIVLERG